jgi:SAM-dependent methyltransferase
MIIMNRLLPTKVSCPCCGWEGRVFADYIEIGYQVGNAECPRCNSHPRHRMLFHWLKSALASGVFQKKGIALVFAPEKCLLSLWMGIPGLKVVRVDREAARDVDLLMDIQHLPLASDCIDFIWCHHVLEHVPYDKAAIRELHRVLRPRTGELMVSVPMFPRPVTREYGFADPTESGHWRAYGDDFVDRLAEARFHVKQMAFSLTKAERDSYGIGEEQVFLCTKASNDQGPGV